MQALIIDDSRVIRSLLRRILSSMGFGTSEAEDGLKGLEQVQQSGSFDVVLVDWNMPEMNGLEFLKAARSGALDDETPIIMVTTENDIDRVCEALEAGANEYLMKPFTDDMLLGKLELVGALPR